MTIIHWPEWPTIILLGILSSLLYLFTLARRLLSPITGPAISHKDIESSCYPPIEALPDFRWQLKEPLKIRPFKPRYNLTMSKRTRRIEHHYSQKKVLTGLAAGIQEANISELIEMDKTYLERITLRKDIMKQHPETVLGAEGNVKPAVDEFYTWLVGTYLPVRYPTIFQVCADTSKEPGYLHNSVTDENLPLLPCLHPKDTLALMGGLVDDDLLFLLPSDDGDSVTLKGFVTCFPNGFDTGKKLGLKLRDIHTPVPQYKEKLERSMDRFFDKLKVGKYVKRANWTIQNSDRLFAATGNHGYEGDQSSKEDLDSDIARVRVERQFLHRLPKTRALLFSFKTFLYTLQEIKDEGLGDALADAIDGLKEGNAPGFHFYKRAAVWGESAKVFLRS